MLGLALLALTALPVYRVLDPRVTGLAGSYTVGLLDIYTEFMWLGLLLLVPIAILGARLITGERLALWSQAVGGVLLRPSAAVFGAGLGLLAAALTAVFSVLVLESRPSNIDALAQLLQARYWAAGMLAGPASDLGGFWGIQNAAFTERGWVSQYPPGHVALLVPFLWLGAAWLLGPVLVFVTVLCTALLAERILEDDPVVARLGTLLLAISPFFLFVSGSLMNHVTTAACVSFGGYVLVRAWQGSAGWAIPAGIAFALSVATRPLSTLAMGAAFALTIPTLWRRPTGHAVRVAAFGLLGALPLLLALLAYNAHFFGAPLRTGYSVTLGPAMGLGWHQDPWGNAYGLTEAIGYTSSDLVALGINLFETPLSAVLVIGAWLLVARRPFRAERLLLAWALLPVLGNALYWHHGLYMGPRMLHEAAPAWTLLFAVAAAGLLRALPERPGLGGGYRARPALAAALVASFAIGLVYLTPRRALSYGGNWIRVFRVPLPETEGPGLVFVHDAWQARIAMTLAAHGMRLDRVETVLRQNPTCSAHQLAQALDAGDVDGARRLHGTLDTLPRANRLPAEVSITPGNDLRMLPGETLAGECLRQARSDRYGIIDIAPLLWQGDLHGAPGDGPLIVRDLGPERNAELLRRHPDRTPWVFAMSAPDGEPQLYPYGAGMARLWDAPAAPGTTHPLPAPE